jgi:hypothetical protein
MDLHHVPLRSNGYKSLRDFTRSSQIHATSPLDLTVQILLRVFALRRSQFSTKKPTSTFPELEICCQVSPHRSTTLISSGIRASDVSMLQPPPSSGSSRPIDTYPPGSTIQIRSSPSALHASGVSSFKLASSQTSQYLTVQILSDDLTLDPCPEQSDGSDLFL